MVGELWLLLVAIVAVVLPVQSSSSTYCRNVLPGHHYYDGHEVTPEFVNASRRVVTVTFLEDAVAYECNCTAEPYPGCMYSWNKLWGSSRCGFAHPHHQDSDRFVWRRQMQPDGTLGQVVELAAYSYDSGDAPYDPPNPNLLQPFNFSLPPGVSFGLELDVGDPAASHFILSDATTGAAIETKTVLHDNACLNAAEGYRLSLYFGGQCRAPTNVSVCYSAEDPQ